MSVLLDPSGPFAAAGAGEGRVNTNDDQKGAELPYTAPPESLYVDRVRGKDLDPARARARKSFRVE